MSRNSKTSSFLKFSSSFSSFYVCHPWKKWCSWRHSRNVLQINQNSRFECECDVKVESENAINFYCYCCLGFFFHFLIFFFIPIQAFKSFKRVPHTQTRRSECYGDLRRFKKLKCLFRECGVGRRYWWESQSLSIIVKWKLNSHDFYIILYILFQTSSSSSSVRISLVVK